MPTVLNKTIKVYPKQLQFLESKALWRAFVGGIGSGKALSLETLLPTPTGWTTMGSIQPGDIIFDECGTPCNVTAIGAVQYERPCREIVFSDGIRIVADVEHEWVTHTFAYRKALARCSGGIIQKTPSLVTTQQIADTLYCSNLTANHAIPLAGSLDCQQVSLPVAPYTMGAWLGDGTTTSATITSADTEVIESIRSEGYGVERIESQKKGQAYLYSIFVDGHRQQRGKNGRYYSDPKCLHVILREIGVSKSKFIPKQYLRASTDQRRKLLCGLMDTDGSVDKLGNCEFTTTNKAIADGFLEICRSLCIKTVIKTGRATIDGVDFGPSYRFSFTPYWPVFTIKRKLIRQRKPGKQSSRQLLRYIKEVNTVDSVPVRCIQVDSPSHQYLVSEGMCPTHNSFIGALDMIRRAKPGRLYLVTAPTYPMLSDASFRSFIDVARQLDIVSPDAIKSSPPPSIKLRTGAEILFRSTDNPETLRGPNLSGWWMDEASLSKREAFDILIGRLRGGNEMGWGTATFTPKGKTHWTYKVFGTGKPDTELIHARTEENIFLPKEFVANIRKHYTEQQTRQELGGLFIDSGGNHYFPESWPRYIDTGDAYRIRNGDRWRHIRKEECSRLITLDWAMGKPKKDAPPQTEELAGDCTAFAVADLTDDYEGQLFILGAVNERIPLGSNAPRLAELCRRWNPIVVSGDDDNLSETMVLECRRYKDIPTIKPMGIKSKNKITRSQAAIIRGERGMIYLPENDISPWVEMVCDQLASFTGIDGEPDDLADCFSILGRLADEFKPGEDRDDDSPVLGAAGYSGIEGGY